MNYILFSSTNKIEPSFAAQKDEWVEIRIWTD